MQGTLDDLEHRVDRLYGATAALDGGEAGYVLTKLRGPDSHFDYAWAPLPPPEIMLYRGDPNAIKPAAKGTLLADIKTPALYQNTDGQKTWVLVNSTGGGSGFPVGPDDDTDGTASIARFHAGAGGGVGEYLSAIITEVVEGHHAGDSPSTFDINEVFEAGDGGLGSERFIEVSGTGLHSILDLKQSRGLVTEGGTGAIASAELRAEGGSFIGIPTMPISQVLIESFGSTDGGGTSGARIKIGTAAFGPTDIVLGETLQGDRVFLIDLPTSDPGVTDQLWNDSGTLKISP